MMSHRCASPFPDLFSAKVEIGRCWNCRKRYQFHPKKWGSARFCCIDCEVAYTKKQRAKKAKRPLTAEDVERARLRRKAREDRLASEARVALWDMKRAEEIRQARANGDANNV